MSFKVCSVINIYYPEISFFSYLSNNANYFDKIFIMNNGASIDFEDFIDLKIKNKIEVMHDRNFGVSKSFNRGIRKALAQGYDFIILLDQDTKIISSITPVIENINNNINKKELYFLNWNKKKIKNVSAKYHKSQPRETISSGTIITKKIIHDIGYMDESLYIDLVDTDYALRAKKKKYELLITNHIFLDHEIGRPKSTNLPFRKKIGSSNHSESRRFFKSRNSIIIFKRYCFYRLDSFYFLVDILKSIFLILALENKKFVKIKYIFHGIALGILGKPIQDKLLKKLL